MSLRLAEACFRVIAAVPEGHAPLRDLDSLRAHMAGEHGFAAAGMLPQRVLLSLHAKDHGSDEGTWGGSSDASRSPGFVAVRRTAADDGPGWWDHLNEGDVITGREQHNRLLAMKEHMRGLGFPVEDTDERGEEKSAPAFTIPDTGHHVWIGHSRKDQTWIAHVSHPGEHLMSGQKTVARVNLGTNAEHVPHLLTREMGSQPLIGEMRRQWARANSGQDYGPRPAGGWRKPDGRRPYPETVHFTARGATLPHDDDEGY